MNYIKLGKGINIVKIWIRNICLLSIASIFLSACRQSQAELIATTTQIAANIYATLTAQAPTITATFTPTPTATITPTPTPAPLPTDSPTPTLDPNTLFKDDFSDQTGGWFVYSSVNGNTKYEDEGFKISVDKPTNTFWSTISRYYTDVNIAVDGQKISGPDLNEYGVMCRVVDFSNMYLFAITSDGHYAIFKLLNGEWIMLSGQNWGFNDHIVKTGNQSNHITATCIGNDLTLAVNDSTLAQVTDSEFPGGDVGIFASAFEQPGVEILFDIFIVTKP